MADAFGSLPGHDLQQADACQAYIQADFEGEEPCVHLPPEAYRGTEYEAECNKHGHPCVRLRKALYGHPDAGSCWERHCDAKCTQAGSEKIPDWPSCYKHTKLNWFLMVYVDDVKFAGPRGNLAKGWGELAKTGLELDPPSGPRLFLGCIHERIK